MPHHPGRRGCGGATAARKSHHVLDLGAEHPITEIRLHAVVHTVNERLGFPRWFKLELARSAARRYFDDDGIVALTGLIAFQNLSSKFNAALDIPAQGFCSPPARPSGGAVNRRRRDDGPA